MYHSLQFPIRLMRAVAVACLLGFISSAALAQLPFGPLPTIEPEPQPSTQPEADPQNEDNPLVVRPQENRVPTQPFQAPLDLEEAPDQVIELNSQYAGWQGVGTGVRKNRVSEELRANWMMVDSNGRLPGRVIPIEGVETENMEIYLLNQGRLVKETRVDEEGQFAFNNVRQGSYALVGWGPEAFFAFGINILAETEDVPRSVPRDVKVMAFQNTTTINTDWIRHFAPSVAFRVFGRYPYGEGAEDAPLLYGFEGLSKYLPKASAATSIANHPIKRTSDGRLIGRVHQMNSDTGRPVDLRTTKVMLLKGDEVFAATDADNYGVFEFPGVPDGQYGLVAAGVDGVGLIAINVSGTNSIMNEDGEMLEANADTGEFIDFCLTPVETIGWLNNYASDLAYRRNLLAPRRPNPNQNKLCDSCNGNGCQQCRGTGLCTSKCQTFEDWAARCRWQSERTKLGSGYIISEAAKDIRGAVDRSGERFERAFYGEGGYNGLGGSGGGGGGAGDSYFGSGGYGTGYQGGGYYNQGGGYNGGGANGYNQGAYAP